MLRIALFLAILALVLVAFAQFIRRNGMFFPDRYPSGDWNPGALPVVPSEHTFVTPDGVKLHGWWFEAADPHAPVMIWFHGNAGNLTYRAPVAAELARRGIAVFVFDYRGFGRSEGRASESKLYLDSLAAFDHVRARGPRPIALYGESIGGPYAAYVAKSRKGVRCVVVENSFPSLKDLGNVLYRPLPLGWTAPRAMRTAAWLNEAGVPVLVMHGKRDGVIPYALGKKLYDELRVPKEMLTSHGGHGEIPFFDARYYPTVSRFINNGGGSA